MRKVSLKDYLPVIVNGRKIFGKFVENVACTGACRTAVGNLCKCSCGGHNHSIDRTGCEHKIKSSFTFSDGQTITLCEKNDCTFNDLHRRSVLCGGA